MEAKLSPWQVRADQVLAVLLKDEGAWMRARFEYGLQQWNFPAGIWRDTFKAIDALRIAHEPVHLTAVHDRCDGKVPLEWIGQRVYLYSEALGGEVLVSNIRALQSHGTRATQLATLEYGLQSLKDADSEDRRAEVVGEVITNLSLDLQVSFQDATAEAVGARFKTMMEEPPERLMKTGVDFIDKVTGGFQHEQIWWLVGAYKSMKSSLMRNIAVNAAELGASVTIATLEGSQAVVTAQIISMFAAQWLLKEGHYHKADSHGRPMNHITPIMLLRLRNRYKTVLHPLQVAAVSAGVLRFTRLSKSLRIYDTTEQNGKLSDMASVQTLVRRDKQMYGLDVLFLDYLQRIEGGGAALYDRVANHALALQGLALKNGICAVVLAQRNEQAIGGGDSYSPGVKGGGDPAATADYLFIMGHNKPTDNGEPDTAMHVELRLARFAPAGSKAELPVHAPSGWILPHENVNDLLDAPAPAPLHFADDAR